MMPVFKNAVYLGSPVDVLTCEDKILTMVPAGHAEYSDYGEIFDCKGLKLFPSFRDAHVHLRDPGFEYKEDIDSGLASAARGGFGSVMAMANTKPVNDNAAVTRYMLDKANITHPYGPGLYPIAAATINLAGEEISPLGELAEAGCIAASNDGKPLKNTEIVRRIMEYAADFNLRFIDHCEDPWLAKGWMMHEGVISGDIGIKGQPGCGESIQVARDLLLAEYLHLPVHIAHVSSKSSLDLIQWAKDRGVRVTAETCPHYLTLTDESVRGYNPNFKMSPPLRSSEDREALLAAVKSGLIDILATDHAPHAKHEKDTTLDMAPFGIIGLELAMPITYGLVEQNLLSEADLVRLWAVKPSEIFGLPLNNFNPGDPADFFLFDPDLEWRATPDELFSKSANTPFLGQIIKGRVVSHWLGGRRLF